VGNFPRYFLGLFRTAKNPGLFQDVATLWLIRIGMLSQNGDLLYTHNHLAFSADAYAGCINNIAAKLKKSINICHCVN